MTLKLCRPLAFAALASLSCAVSAESAATGETSAFWYRQGEESLARALATPDITSRARNIILFVGDGNGITSVTATRIFDGQSKGLRGEEHQLSFETLPHVALAKTYNTNQQTPDSAGTMTAIMTGVKTSAGVISIGPETTPGDCRENGSPLPTLLEQARQAGRATGIVSTTRITHATPAATYAHSVNRDWEADVDIPTAMKACSEDIASQLVGNGAIDVVMGGGRSNFLPASAADPEYKALRGKRGDSRNLVAEWSKANPSGRYIWNSEQFEALPTDFSGAVLALFEPSHMQYEADRKTGAGDEPSLSAMTATAIDLLETREAGYFLMVEAGRIDHAHHAGNAYRALADGQELSRAVQIAMDATDPQETLIIVTADHSHVLSMAGYPTRGNPILGLVEGNDDSGKPAGAPTLAADGRPYTTLGYINGQGYGRAESPEDRYRQTPNPGRHLESGDNTTGKHFHQESLVPSSSETHGGEDVAIYARGPWAHLIDGVQEQSYIYYVMRHAMGL